MQDLAIYELVDAKIRGTIDLTTIQKSIEDSFAQAYSEATDVKVYQDFYCYRHPVSSDAEKSDALDTWGKYWRERRASLLSKPCAAMSQQGTQGVINYSRQ